MFGLVLTFARTYLDFGFQCGPKAQPGANSVFYLSAITWTNLGYSDCEPGANARFFAGVEAVLGFVFLSIFIGYFVELFSAVARKSESQ